MAGARTSRLWILGGIGTAMVVGTVGWAASAGAADPDPTPEELLTSVQEPTVTDLSGTVLTRGDLGLPASLQGLIEWPAPLNPASGRVATQVWVDGEDRQRITALTDAAQPTTAPVADTELSAVRDGDTMWVWSASERSAARYTEDPDTASTSTATPIPATPAEMAREVLDKLGEDADVTVEDSQPVAGRDTVVLVVDPRDPATLVSDVRISVDRETNVVLRVQVGSTELAGPAIDTAFTSVSYDEVSPDVFAFTPPAGATVTERTAEKSDKSDKPTPVVIGDGWSSVAIGEFELPGMPGASPEAARDLDPEQQKQMMQVARAYLGLPTVSGPWGTGRAVSGTLFSAIITDDGRYAVGAVDVDTLSAALAQK